MSSPQAKRRPTNGLRRLATHPLVPAVFLSTVALAAAAQGHVLTWAILGGLTGYTLSGSV